MLQGSIWCLLPCVIQGRHCCFTSGCAFLSLRKRLSELNKRTDGLLHLRSFPSAYAKEIVNHDTTLPPRCSALNRNHRVGRHHGTNTCLSRPLYGLFSKLLIHLDKLRLVTMSQSCAEASMWVVVSAIFDLIFTTPKSQCLTSTTLQHSASQACRQRSETWYAITSSSAHTSNFATSTLLSVPFTESEPVITGWSVMTALTCKSLLSLILGFLVECSQTTRFCKKAWRNSTSMRFSST